MAKVVGIDVLPILNTESSTKVNQLLKFGFFPKPKRNERTKLEEDLGTSTQQKSKKRRSLEVVNDVSLAVLLCFFLLASLFFLCFISLFLFSLCFLFFLVAQHYSFCAFFFRFFLYLLSFLFSLAFTYKDSTNARLKNFILSLFSIHFT